MFFEVALLHLSGKLFETHLWQSAFQQSCYLMLATMRKKITLWWRFFKEFPKTVKYSCCSDHHWRRKIWISKKKKKKSNNSKGAGSLCINYTHSRICFCISCKSMKSKSWCPRMVAYTQRHSCSKYYKIAVVRVTIFRHCTLKGWNNNGQIQIFGRVHYGTFFNPKNSCMYMPRSKTSRGV